LDAATTPDVPVYLATPTPGGPHVSSPPGYVADTKFSVNRGFYAVKDRWTPALVKEGFTPVSNFFLAHYHDLKPEITHGEAMLIIQLMSFKWDADMPYPSYKTLAKRMLLKDAQARSLARGLEKKGYLRRHVRMNLPNLFDLTPVFVALEKLRSQRIAEETAAGKRRAVR
jgi:hypothetical protein